jgi:glycosyltransferase involved in cell wall biosynthesis
MRIAIDANPMFLTRAGIGNYTYHLVRQLVRVDQEHEYYLYNTVTREQELGGLKLGANAHVICFPRILSSWRARKDRIDVYHGVSYQLWAQGRAGSVVTVHDLALAKFPEFSKRLLGEQWSGYKTLRTLRRATRVIAVSQNTANDISNFYQIPSEKIRVIYNGVGEEFFSPSPTDSLKSVRARYRIPSGDYILYVGGSDPRKNLERLLEAFSILLKKIKPPKLVLTGGVGRRAKEIYQKISELGLEHHVVLTGHLPTQELRLLYSGARLFAYPSLYEGFGIPVLEAMACGVPVMTSNTSSLPEVAGDAACLIDPYDVQAMAAAMEKILKDNDLAASLQAKGLERVKAFSWERAARQTLEVYKECLT